MNNYRSEIIAEVVTRQNLEAEITARQEIEAIVTTRLNLEAEITTRQRIEATIDTRVVEGGYYASVRNETLHLQKEISIDGSELVFSG